MTPPIRASYEQFQQRYGQPKPPTTIWQDFLDTDIKAIKRLCGLSSTAPREGDLDQYISHLRYIDELQQDLFVYLLPNCLQIWHQILMAQGQHDSSGEAFHATLAGRPLLQTMLTEPQRAAVYWFMSMSLLDRLDMERGLTFLGNKISPYHWIRHFTSLGTILPTIEALWQDWWTAQSRGQAVTMLQYISCLMYPSNANPVFAPLTPLGGGGPPSLWDYDNVGNNEIAWLPENADFLTRTLTLHYLREKIELAGQRLTDEPEYAQAARIQQDFPEWEWLVQSRMEELPRLLTSPRYTTILEWSVD